jgi:hypothetical protein
MNCGLPEQLARIPLSRSFLAFSRRPLCASVAFPCPAPMIAPELDDGERFLRGIAKPHRMNR